MAGRARRFLLWSGGTILVLGLVAWSSFRLSPWPGALLVRRAFERGAAQTSQALTKHVPAGIVARLDLVYDERDPDARFDLFLPPEGTPRGATLVWVHGGGWVSGSKEELANWARILAGRGHALVMLDYTLAPEAHYPTPVRQVNRALGHLVAQADELGLDADRLVLAGDSAGAHIVAQVANLASSTEYARLVGIEPALERARIRGLVLFCGPFDVGAANFDGPFGSFLRTVLWAYCGTRDFRNDEFFASATVLAHLSREFPPAFVSAGNGDPLLVQSQALAARLAELGVEIETLFFPPDHAPPLGHEYQFALDTEPARLALERALAFVVRVSE